MTSRSENCRLGVRDPEPSPAPAPLIEDEVPMSTQARLNSDVTARKIAGDATPEPIVDEEPTVLIKLQRAGILIPLDRPAR